MKSLKNYILSALICLIFLFIGGFFVGISNNFVFAQEGEGVVDKVSKNAVILLQGTKQSDNEIKVDVEVEENTGILALKLEIQFDKTAMELTKVDKGTALSSLGIIWAGDLSVANSNGKLVLHGEGTVEPIDNDYSTGKLMTLTFKVKESAQDGDYSIKLSYEKNKDVTYIENKEAKTKNIITNSVKVTLKESQIEKVETTEQEGTMSETTAVAPFGNGTKESPYIIQNAENLKFVAENIEMENYAKGNYILQSSIEIDFSIGTEQNPFRGVFNGNGKTITVRLNGKPSTNKLGLFAFANGATIKNLAVEFNAVLESGETENQKVVVGGIVGSAVSTTIEESYSNFSLSATKTETLNENEIKNFFVEKEEGIFETFKYNGEIVAGGLVGEANSIKIKNSYSVPEIKIYQTSNKQSVFGGIVGNVNNGEIRNVYVAPTGHLSSAIASKNGVLTAVESKNCQIAVNSTNGEIVFGGIAGYALGGNLVISNTFFGGLVASNEGNLVAGGIVGKIPTNKTFWPKQIEYGKFVGLSNPNVNVVETLSAIGNFEQVVDFVVPTSVSSILSLPSLAQFKSWNWNIFDSWDFENVWKEISIVNQTQGFFPTLQGFSTFKIQVATNKVVSLDKNGNYLSGFVTFKINGQDKTSLDVTAGSEVTITAMFHEENGNALRNFKNYFEFTNWIFNEIDVKGAEYNVILNSNGIATLTFKASSKTEGIYDVQIKGKPVEVNVLIKNTNEQDQTQNIGNVLKNGAVVENLSFEIKEYQNGELVSLKAIGTELGDYIFDRWEDPSNNFQSSKSEIVFELNNEKSSSSSRLYPVVKYDEVEGKLVANLNAYFSNNTSKIKFEIVGNGKININETEINNGDENSFVNQKQIEFSAKPNEENEFVGWFIGNEKVSEDLNYSLIVSESLELTAKFKPIEKEEGFVFPVWAIILVVVAPIVFGGIIALIVIKIKKGKRGGYKKHYF